MADKALPSPEGLRQLLRYDAETGDLFWLPRDNAQVTEKISGKRAGSVNQKGYLAVSVTGITLLCHRVSWAIHHGEWPSENIDHINGVKSDNRICNLRLAGPDLNNKNRAVGRNNKTGVIGVMRFNRRWRSNIWNSGKNVYLGTFDCIGLAIKRRKNAELQFGFHENHGKR